jgi:hypothetical protein
MWQKQSQNRIGPEARSERRADSPLSAIRSAPSVFGDTARNGRRLGISEVPASFFGRAALAQVLANGVGAVWFNPANRNYGGENNPPK